MQTHVRLNPSERPGASCIVLPPADPRGVIDHGLPGVARGINHRSRRLALANLSSASEALNLSTRQRTERSGAARFGNGFSNVACSLTLCASLENRKCVKWTDTTEFWAKFYPSCDLQRFSL